MSTYKVSWEIELEAENPLEAAKEAQRWMTGCDWAYYVQEDGKDEIFSVDLSEEDEDAVLSVSEYNPLIK